MNIISISGIALVGVFFSIVLKQYKAEYALAVSFITAVCIMLVAVGWITPILSEIENLITKSQISYSNLSVLIKAIGICYVTQITSDICKDAGQAAIASKIELVGRIALCISVIPLYREILSLVETIIGRIT